MSEAIPNIYVTDFARTYVASNEVSNLNVADKKYDFFHVNVTK